MPISIEDVEKAIIETGADWSAGETEVSAYLERPVGDTALFGLDIGDEDADRLLAEARQLEATTFHVMAPPPPAIDWRNKSGANYVSPVRHQQTCGSCVAFATCAALESRLAIAQEQPDPGLDLSEAHLFFCGCGRCCRTGWHFDKALNWASNGIGAEAQFPYSPQDQPCPNPQPTAVVQVPRWGAVTSPTARKQAIASNGPVIGGLRVYEDFYFYTSGIYKHLTGIFRGLHAVCVVGYDDGGGYWIIKNSWGTGWGEGGFMRIAYGQCDLDATYAFYDPDVVTVGGVTV